MHHFIYSVHINGHIDLQIAEEEITDIRPVNAFKLQVIRTKYLKVTLRLRLA